MSELLPFSAQFEEPRRHVRTSESATPKGFLCTGEIESKEGLRLQLQLLLMSLDVICLALSMWSSNTLKFREGAASHGVDLFLLICPIFVLLAASNGAYGPGALTRPVVGITRSLRSLAIAGGLVLGLLFGLKLGAAFSRQIFAVGLFLAAALIGAARWSVGNAIGHRLNWRFTNEVLIVDGSPVRPRAGEFVLIADAVNADLTRGDPETLEHFGTVLRNADRVVLAAPPERRSQWIRVLKGTGVDVEVLAGELDRWGPVGLRRYWGRATLLVGMRPLGIADRLKKRALDLCLCVPALLLLSPLLVAIAVAIKVDSPGPILFRQRRIGQANRTFCVLKFRSMRLDVCDATASCLTTARDPRVTRVGRFIRRTSLDELPQLFNVLRGEMSLVGPRPHAAGAKAGEYPYWEVHPQYWCRGAIKPGLTGLAQVRGYRGPTDTHQQLIDRVDSDLEYLVDWTVWRDLALIARTVRVIAHANAF